MRKQFLFLFLVSCIIFLTTPLFSSLIQAEVIKSNCVTTKVGTVENPPPLPAGCDSSINGLEIPPNLTCVAAPAQESNGKAGEYCKLPDATDGSYKHHGTVWGAKEMIGVIYTVSKNWKQKYPQGHVKVGDISADNHKTHFWGIAVDITATTNGTDCVANKTCSDFNGPATIEFGKMIIDTGAFDTIWFNGDVQATYEGKSVTVNGAIFAYAKNKDSKRYTENSPGNTGIRPLEGHSDHFHLNIDRGFFTSNSNSNNDKSKLRTCTSVSGVKC